MTGTGWILVYFTILDNFAFWARSENGPEMMLLIFFVSQCKLQGKIDAQINFGYNFLLEGPTDFRSTPLSYIFHALFRDTPLGHVYCAQPNSQIAKLAKYLMEALINNLCNLCICLV